VAFGFMFYTRDDVFSRKMFLSLLKKDWLLFVVGFEGFLGWFASVLIWGF